MSLHEDVASAVSGHRFEDAVPHLDESVTWDVVGAPPLVGRDAVAEAFRAAAEELTGAPADFTRFRVLEAGDTVVVDSRADYAGDDGTSTVASCDLYDFDGDRLVAIRSYNVEV